MLARARGALRNCGADLAAHCINDVLTCGAEPLLFLDYVAANRIELEQVAELVEGAAGVCREAGVALVGGETAELPGIYRDGELDFAGTCVGIVERERVIDGSRIEVGDAVVGFPSAGVHANGFTLVRRILELEDYDGEDLLAPTRLYLDDVRQLRETLRRSRARACHGRRDPRQPRARPARTGLARSWTGRRGERPPVFGWLARHVDEDELRRVFNLGIGYVAVVSDPGEFSSSGRSCARDRGPRQRGGDEPAGAARRRPARRRRRIELAPARERSCGPRRPACPTGVFALAGLRRIARRATGRWPTGSRSRVSSSSSARGTCTS